MAETLLFLVFHPIWMRCLRQIRQLPATLRTHTRIRLIGTYNMLDNFAKGQTYDPAIDLWFCQA
ncbi:hypothetical protein RSK20926_19557 [Roseobacter sp. SK209-2-6]|nr:hypothetical protein RSK20926_19557 [Roseobacter sp. SK209-2-6]